MGNKKRLQILKIKSHQLRCCDCDISFQRSSDINDVKTISFIVMPNGGGKTTIRDLVTLCLSGTISSLGSEEIYKFRHKSEQNPADYKYESGKFELALEYDSNRYDYELNFDFQSRICETRTKDTISGNWSDGIKVPHELRDFFNKNFLSIWNFDGELIDKFYESNENISEEFITFLMRFNLLDKVIGSADSYLKQKISGSMKKIPKADTISKNIQIAENRYEELKNLLDKWKIEKENLDNDIKKNDQYLEKLRNKINPELNTKINELKEKIVSLEKSRNDKSIYFLQSLRNPLSLGNFFSDKLEQFKDSLDSAKLPTTTAKAFFDDLINKYSECVCGEKLTDEKRRIIEKNKDKYLDDDEWGVLNSIKTSIENDLESKNVIDYDGLSKELMNYDDEILLIKNKIKELDDQINNSTDEDRQKFQNALKESNNLSHKYQKLDEKIKIVLGPKSEDPEQINPAKMKTLENLSYYLRRKKADLVDAGQKENLSAKFETLEKILVSVKKSVKEIVSQQLIDDINNKIRSILTTSVRIKKISNHIELDGATNASVGQKLIILYSFITFLLDKAQFRSIFIADSPFGSLGIKERQKFSTQFPDSSDKQLIFFITTSEREGVAKIWEERFKDDINYIVLHSNRSDIKDTNIENINANIGPNDKKIELQDGVQILGKNYFHKVT